MRNAPFVRRIICSITALLIVVATPLPVPAAGGSLEFPVKATFLYKFGDFVQWPSEAFESGETPLCICITGIDPFGDVLPQAVAGRRSGGRNIILRRVERVTGKDDCHILFIGRDAGQTITEVLQALEGVPVLTVTDAAGQAANIGMIHFVVQDDRVRFYIDDSAAAAAGLTISSKLLDIALSVRSRN